jgi:FMN-binding domain
VSVPAVVLVLVGAGLVLVTWEYSPTDGMTPMGADAMAPLSAIGDAARAGTGSAGSPSGLRATAPGERVVLGRVVPTTYGDVQVGIVVRGTRIIDVVELKRTHEGEMSTRVNARALPVLYRETVAAGSARIDAVSGATVTSDGYRQSLQFAVDRAHLG